MKSFYLLKTQRFAPFFATQFLGAFNDNVYKNALVIIIAFTLASETEAGVFANIAAGLFILPFFLFSPLAGQLADKIEKGRLIRIIKFAEIVIMLLGAVAFFSNSIYMMLGILFLMGAQSAFFGPVKYSIIPQHLKDNELVSGNALIELGTFLAILLGTILGGILSNIDLQWLSSSIVFFAILGWLVSLKIPVADAGDPHLKINWNPFTESIKLWREIRKYHSVFLAALAISWFWFLGMTILAQLPNYTKFFLAGDKTVVTLLLATFSLSIGVGSLICERLCRDEIEIGLIPIGAMGISLFCGDLYFIEYAHLNSLTFLSIAEFLAVGFHSWRVIFDIFMIGVCGAVFIVPLYALIQDRTESHNRSRIIAATNIFNAIFMVLSSVLTIALFKFGFNTIEVFAAVALLNTLVSIWIFTFIPEFTLRFGLWILAKFVYKLKYKGRSNIPHRGAAVIVANHVSYIDWFIISAACQRPVRFVMHHQIYNIPVLKIIFRLAHAIPIAPAKEDADAKEKAFSDISQTLRDGDIVCIFPEGNITQDGEMMPFKPGIERIIKSDPVPVIPMYLDGLWGSFFSRSGKGAFKGKVGVTSRRLFVHIGEAIHEYTPAKELESIVKTLGEKIQNEP
jgi:1-acyl-sn-glycerol-3-phosphate acyltransferase